MAMESPGKEFVTIVPVGENRAPAIKTDFVTVLTLGDTTGAAKVAVTRPKGSRLGLGLKFEGGSAAVEKVRRLLVQSCAEDSPAAKAIAPWGKLIPGDEILAIDDVPVSDLTRIDCVRRLKDSDEILTLLIKHFEAEDNNYCKISKDSVSDKIEHKTMNLTLPPPVPPRKLGKKNSFQEKSILKNGNKENGSGLPPKNLNDGQNITLTVNNKISRKSSFDSQLHRQTKESFAILKRGSPEEVRRLVRKLSDGKTLPPEADLYVDLLSSEWERGSARTDAESDDTGSSISTVVDRFSSMTSSVENSKHSTPIMQHKSIDIQKVIDCIDNIDSDILRDITTSSILEKGDAKNDVDLYDSCVLADKVVSIISDEITHTVPDKFMSDNNNNHSNTNKSFEDNVVGLPDKNNKHLLKIDHRVDKPKPLPRTNKNDLVSIENTVKPITGSVSSVNMVDRLLTPTKKDCIETWLQHSEAEMGKDSDEDLVPGDLPRLIDFVPKPQFKEADSKVNVERPLTAPPPPPPADLREDGSGASLDTIGELDETNDVVDNPKFLDEDVKTTDKESFRNSFWTDRITKSDGEDKNHSNGESPSPTFPRQPPDGVETPCDIVEKNEDVSDRITSRLSSCIESNWTPQRSKFTYISRTQDEKSKASVKDKIAMFSSDNTPMDDKVYKTLPKSNLTMKYSNGSYYSISDVPILDKRLTKSQDNLDDFTHLYKSHNERPEVLGAQDKTHGNKPIITTTRSLQIDHKPLFYGSTTNVQTNNIPSGYYTRSVSDDNGKSSHKSNLEYLIEQRKKSMSKLKGLVIPEAHAQIIDLPPIRVQQSHLKFLPTGNRQKNNDQKNLKENKTKSVNVNESKWKNNILPNNMPKYSPAFKRKSLQVYSPSIFKDSISPEKVYANGLNNKKPLSSSFRSPLDPINGMGKIYDGISRRYSLHCLNRSDSKDIIHEPKQFHNVEVKICTITDVVDSDNDSAMSSTQSSYRSSASSPLHNLDSIESDSSRISPRIPYSSYPLVKSEMKLTTKRELCRTTSSDTSTSLSSSAGSSATSGSQASCSSLESSNTDTDTKKNGKSSHIDTINRRNILASAKCSSGRDAKLNSPVIETKFSHDSYEVIPCPRKTSTERLSSLTNTVSANNNKGENRRRAKVINESDSESDGEINFRQRKNDSKNSRVKKTASINKKTELLEIPKLDEAPKAISERIIKEIKKAGLDNYNSIKMKIEASDLELLNSQKEKKLQETVRTHQNGTKTSYQKPPTLNEKPKLISSDSTDGMICNDQYKKSDYHSKTIVLKRTLDSGGVGLILSGGSDCEAKDVKIHRVLADSIAEKAGLVRGARVLSINGASTGGMTHAQSVSILKEQRTEVSIEIEDAVEGSDKQTSNLKSIQRNDSFDDSVNTKSVTESVILEKAGGGAGLGFGLDGGRDSPNGDLPLTIKKLFAGGAAARSGRISVGAELLSAGGQSLEDFTRTQAWAALKALPDGPVTIVIKNP